MKAYYREISEGFVLELRQILLHTAAIFVPRGEVKFEFRMSPEFIRNRTLLRYKSTNSEKFRRIRNRENQKQQTGKTGGDFSPCPFGKVTLKKWVFLAVAELAM